MKTMGEVRAQVIGHLTAAYHQAAETGQGLEPGALYLDPEPPDWNLANLIVAYADMTVLLVDFARKAERLGGISLLEYLQEQALALLDEDALPADPGSSTS